MTAAPSPAPGAGRLFKAIGLSPDGPVVWGSRVTSRSAGVFVVEWPTTLASAPLDHSRLRAWIERVPTLAVDGVRATASDLAARLDAFWLPRQTVVYVGSTRGSLGGRVAAMIATPLGDRRPFAGAHWLWTLSGIDRARVWWGETEAVEEYEDALLNAFAAGVAPEEVTRLHDPLVVLPFANRDTATGERKAHGISGALLAEPAPTEAAARERAGATARAAAAATRKRGAAARAATPRVRRPVAAPGMLAARTHLSAEGLAALQAELDELRTARRPEVIARVKAARELGDLRENADYEAARNEQSFLEGRIQALQAMIDTAEVIPEGTSGGEVRLGSRVVVDIDGTRDTFHIVGSSEADPAAGRISGASPVGRALLGRRAGDDVTVTLPAGTITYRVVEIV